MKRFAFCTIIVALIVAVPGCGNKGSGDVAEAGETQPPAEASEESVTYAVVPSSSQITWEGYKPGTTHTGTVELASGELQVSGDRIEGGEFTIDMTTITDTDLEPGEGKEKLEAHLKGTAEGKETDFFNVKEYPTATFEITDVTRLENDPEANYMIYGNLTIKGISKGIAFRAKVDMINDKLVANTPLFKIDRTEWDINFRSKNFFENLGDNVIQDEFGLAIRLAAKRVDPAG